MNLTATSATLVALLASAATWAAGSPERPAAAPALQAPGFVQLDVNGDRKLDKQEVDTDPRLNARWQELDDNADGSVSAAEFSALEVKKPELPAVTAERGAAPARH